MKTCTKLIEFTKAALTFKFPEPTLTGEVVVTLG
jgi:hypothetical protein